MLNLKFNLKYKDKIKNQSRALNIYTYFLFVKKLDWTNKTIKALITNFYFDIIIIFAHYRQQVFYLKYILTVKYHNCINNFNSIHSKFQYAK